MPWAWAWWLALCIVAIALLVLLLVAWDEQRSAAHVEAVGGVIALVALVAAGAAVLLAIPQYREWSAEFRRFADFAFWIELAQDDAHPGNSMPRVDSEELLPDDPNFVMNRRTLVARACVTVRDRFPLRNATVNIVVPSRCRIRPLGESGQHRASPTVTPNDRVNPDGDHGVRWTAFSGDLSPHQHFTIAAEVEPTTPEPFRVMVELSCTSAPEEQETMRFALVAPSDWTHSDSRGPELPVK